MKYIILAMLLWGCGNSHKELDAAYEAGIMDGSTYTYEHGYYPSMWHRQAMHMFHESGYDWRNIYFHETERFWDSVKIKYLGEDTGSTTDAGTLYIEGPTSVTLTNPTSSSGGVTSVAGTDSSLWVPSGSLKVNTNPTFKGGKKLGTDKSGSFGIHVNSDSAVWYLGTQHTHSFLFNSDSLPGNEYAPIGIIDFEEDLRVTWYNNGNNKWSKNK